MNPLSVPNRSASHHLPASGAHTPATVPIPNFAPSSIRVGQPPLRHAPNCCARCVVLLFDSPPTSPHPTSHPYPLIARRRLGSGLTSGEPLVNWVRTWARERGAIGLTSKVQVQDVPGGAMLRFVKGAAAFDTDFDR